MKPKKSMREKLADSKDLPKTIVVPAPLEVDALMKQVPPGKIATITEIRATLARQHRTDVACPMTTGIFAWMAAQAAEEAEAAGEADITPYWRTLKTGGELNAKYPGGIKDQKRRLEAEGHKVAKKGRTTIVRDFERALFRFER